MRRLVLFAMMLALAPSMLAQTGKAEQQVLQAEKDRFAAMVKGDRAALEKLLADDLTYTHSTALCKTKEEFIKSVTGGNIDYVSIVPSEPDWKVRVNGNTAIVNGVAAVNVIDNGKDRKIRIRFTTVHANRSGAGSCWRGRRRSYRDLQSRNCTLESEISNLDPMNLALFMQMLAWGMSMAVVAAIGCYIVFGLLWG